MKKKKFFFFFEIFEKSADFATKFGWGISATKGSPLWKKNEIDQKRYPNISVFFGFHFVFFGFSGTRGNFPLRKKKKNEMDRITPNWTEQLGYLLTRMLPDLARFGGQFPRSGSFSRCGDLVSRSGQIWPDLGIWEIFFFKKKKKTPDLAQSSR